MTIQARIFKYCFVFIVVCMTAGMAGAAEKIPVYVSIAPQQYFVQQIGKDLVHVRIMVAPGASPATYEPKPRQMTGISKAKAYFAVGVPFEGKWLKKIAAANPGMKVVHTDSGIKKIPMAANHHLDDGEEGDHHDGHDHDHGEEGLDPHIWLSPSLVKIQANHILRALQDIDPPNSDFYAKNCSAFIREIDMLDARLKTTFADWKDRRFLVFHPSWGYFAQAYGMKMTAIEVEGKAPKPARLKALIEYARNEGIKVVFVQPQFSTKSARLIASEIGGQVAFADPLAEQWADNLIKVADQFKATLN